MTAILGISAFYHDSAAALILDGRIAAAAQEERFTRRKHDARFPVSAIAYCLDSAGLGPQDLDYVGFYDQPLLKFERLLETYLSYAPRGLRSFARAMPAWLRHKLHLPREIRRGLGAPPRHRPIFIEHHESHAASAFFPSPFEEAAVLTLDGVGEWATASFGAGRGATLTLSHELRFPHSLGLLYSAFTHLCGFKVNSGEYKLMGLSPYGEPRFLELLRGLVDLKDDGSFRLDLSYFDYCAGLTMTAPRLHRLLGGPPRRPEAPLTQRELDLAASVQRLTEDIVLRIARHVHRVTRLPRLCLAGGVALNCAANGRLLRDGPFEGLWIQPAAGDAGGALGVALHIWHQLLGQPRVPDPLDSQRGSLLGPAYTDADIGAFLDRVGARYRVLPDDDALCDHVAELLAAQQVVGWLYGRMEFGPRALGGRSILADPRSIDMQGRLNDKIKRRESFRPFAPAVTRERAADLFALRQTDESPYMLLVAPLRPEQRVPLSAADQALTGLDRRAARRSTLPAVTHVDGSARIQTVDPQRHGRFYHLLRAFERRTGTPVLLNTSFNVRGEPLVCSPEDAYRCFLATDLDVLVLEHHVLRKAEQTGAAGLCERPTPWELD